MIVCLNMPNFAFVYIDYDYLIYDLGNYVDFRFICENAIVAQFFT